MEKKKAYAVATAHLDTVWRWNLAQTADIYLPDTLAKNFDLIEKYPNYKFNFEGAYRYKLIEGLYPAAFEKIKDYVSQGRWCVSGTAYENGDVNIPSPEAIIRNLLYGHKYFMHSFGKSSCDIFLPDCFGFGWALPSIAAHCGLKGFTTQKLSWGSASPLPYDLTRWAGPDGKEIFAAVNAGSYRYKFSGDIRADLGIINRIALNANSGNLPWANHLYGTGDKGGAPTEESVKAVSNSAETDNDDFQVISASGDRIFTDMDKLSDKQKTRLPLWNSELLMTRHGAGCYTSRCMSKRLNRQNEQFGAAAEKACVLACVMGGYDYPRQALSQAWRRVIRHQFHDDITGTSLMEVYNDSWNDYYLSLSQFKSEFIGASRRIMFGLNSNWTQKNSAVLMVGNPTQFKRKSVTEAVIRTTVNCREIAVFDSTGREYPCQVINKSGKALTVVFQTELDGFEYKLYEIRPAERPCQIKTDLKVTNHSIENFKYKLIFNKNGDIAYIYDKKLGRQIIEKPLKLALLHDTGSLAYPSWEITKEDIDRTPYCYAHTPEFTVLENGPARAAIRVTRSIGQSTVSQVVSLDTQSEYINISNSVDWRSRRTMLKAVFPLAAHNENASYDLGLGVIRRPTNSDSLYEVPAQKWADISDSNDNFGVSIFSDSKYGWDKPDDHTLRLTCIHTPAGAFTKETRQDLQDLGRNYFSFAVFSHSKDFDNGTQKYSEIYTNPLLTIQNDSHVRKNRSDSVSLASISSEAVLIRAIKFAEDDNGIIVRVNEANGKSHKSVKLSLACELGRAFEVNGLEENPRKHEITNNGIIFDIAPFEVKTFKLFYKKKLYKVTPERHYLPVKLEFNAKGFSAPDNEMKHIIAQGSGLSFPTELLPKSGELTAGGIPFVLPQRPGDRYDIFVCRGQKIFIDDNCSRLYFLAGSVIDKQEIVIKAGKKENILTIKPITGQLSRWDMAGLNQTAYVNTAEKVGFEFEHTHHPEGINSKTARFYLYSIYTAGVNEIVFPENNRVIIIAATQITEKDKFELCTRIEDAPSKGYSFDDRLSTADRIIDKADFATIRAGKIQDQINNGKGKGFKRDNIITNIIRSYTKSEW